MDAAAPPPAVDPLYTALLEPVAETAVRRVVIGVNWTMVETELGCGLAQTPRRDAPGCQPVANAGHLTELTLRTLADKIVSDNPLEAALGMAAINAHHNRYDRTGVNENGLDVFRDVDGPVTVVGRFPGLGTYLKDFRVVEREPRPGEYAERDLARLVSDSAGVIITASTLVNGSAAGILATATGRRLAIVGPGTPLAPCLHVLGIEVLAGSVIEDADRAAEIVGQSGAAAHLKACSRYVTLRAAS